MRDSWPYQHSEPWCWDNPCTVFLSHKRTRSFHSYLWKILLSSAIFLCCEPSMRNNSILGIIWAHISNLPLALIDQYLAPFLYSYRLFHFQDFIHRVVRKSEELLDHRSLHQLLYMFKLIQGRSSSYHFSVCLLAAGIIYFQELWLVLLEHQGLCFPYT